METESNTESTQPKKFQVPRAVERIEMLEKELPRFAQGFKFISHELEMLKESLRNITEVVQAMVKVGGESYSKQLQEAIFSGREEVRLDKLNEEKSRIATLVTEGNIAPTDVAIEETLVIGAEFTADDQPVGLGYVSVNFNSFVEDVKNKLRGNGPGFKLDLPDGKFKILEVYKIVKPPEEAMPADAIMAEAQSAIAAADAILTEPSTITISDDMTKELNVTTPVASETPKAE